MGHLFPAEETLNLTLCGRIALLHFCAAHGGGFCIVGLGGACGAADSVTSGPSPQQNNHISRIGSQTLNRASWSRSHHRADFHTFCRIIRMINFLYISGCQTNLVAVRTVSMGRLPDQFFLGKLALHGF